MKRDMDLVRLLMLHAESADEKSDYPEELSAYPERVVQEHLKLLISGGFLRGHWYDDHEGNPEDAEWTGITWQGYDFIDSVRDPEVWRRARDLVIKPGKSFTLSILSETLKTVIKQSIGLP
jgi:hypothetical protein